MLLQIDKKQMDPDITVLEFTGKISLGRESQRIETSAVGYPASPKWGRMSL